jgi:hypothetical protein
VTAVAFAAPTFYKEHYCFQDLPRNSNSKGVSYANAALTTPYQEKMSALRLSGYGWSREVEIRRRR